VDDEGTLYFNELRLQKTWKVPLDGEKEIFRSANNGANGMVFDGEGNLICCEIQKLTRVSTATGSVSTLSDSFQGQGLGPEVNDLTVLPDGGIYFTSPIWDNQNGRIFYRSPDGDLTVVDEGLRYPNGLEYVEESDYLYVCITQAEVLHRYTVKDDFSLGEPEQFNLGKGLLDGMEVDLEGNLYIVSHMNAAVYVYDSDVEYLGSIELDGESNAQNCTFGWGDDTNFYIGANSAVYRVKMNVKGRKGNSTTPIRNAAPALKHAPFHAADRPVLGLQMFPRSRLHIANSKGVYDLHGRIISSQ
jgi:gluconolactonase